MPTSKTFESIKRLQTRSRQRVFKMKCVHCGWVVKEKTEAALMIAATLHLRLVHGDTP